MTSKIPFDLILAKEREYDEWEKALNDEEERIAKLEEMVEYYENEGQLEVKIFVKNYQLAGTC